MSNFLTKCPNCHSEVDGMELAYGRDRTGENVQGCDYCITEPVNRRDQVERAAASVLGKAFAEGRINVPEVDYANALAVIADEIAEASEVSR